MALVGVVMILGGLVCVDERSDRWVIGGLLLICFGMAVVLFGLA